MKLIIYIAVAGALGTLSRYWLGTVVNRIFGSEFPYGTLVINVLGCLIIGYFMYVALNTADFNPILTTAFTIGFLGAFTTFCTFSYETIKLIENGSWFSAMINIMLNITIGLFSTIFGFFLGKLTLGH